MCVVILTCKFNSDPLVRITLLIFCPANNLWSMNLQDLLKNRKRLKKWCSVIFESD